MSDFIEVSASTLIGSSLDWAVATIEFPVGVCYSRMGLVTLSGYRGMMLRYSTDWNRTGPLIDKHNVSLHCPQSTDDVWAAWIITDQKEVVQGGDTALIAACRAIVCALIGETIQVPADLIVTAEESL